jgi:hypothetical protein
MKYLSVLIFAVSTAAVAHGAKAAAVKVDGKTICETGGVISICPGYSPALPANPTFTSVTAQSLSLTGGTAYAPGNYIVSISSTGLATYTPIPQASGFIVQNCPAGVCSLQIVPFPPTCAGALGWAGTKFPCLPSTAAFGPGTPEPLPPPQVQAKIANVALQPFNNGCKPPYSSRSLAEPCTYQTSNGCNTTTWVQDSNYGVSTAMYCPKQAPFIAAAAK